MHIAIDIRNLARARSGIARAIENACLALVDDNHRLSLFCSGKLHPDFSALKELSNATIYESDCVTPVQRVVWGSRDLPKYVTTIQPDVFWAPAHRLSSRLAHNVPCALTVHDSVWRQAPGTMRLHRLAAEYALSARAIAAAHVVMTVSRNSAAELKKLQPRSRNKTLIVPNITHRTAAGPTSETILEGPDDLPSDYCLFVGTLEPRKNLGRLIDAFMAVPPNIRGSLSLVIAGGDGWKSKSVKDRIARHSEYVKWVGRVSEAELSQLYSKCRFVVMPSLYEGFGYPAIEAEARGKLVVISKDTSLDEVSSSTAIKVDPLETASITGGLVAALSAKPSPRDVEIRTESASRFGSETVLPLLIGAFDMAIERFHEGKSTKSL
ncbi:MAG: glycosyltransferase family 1 protein [Pseudomonadota bacterium]